MGSSSSVASEEEFLYHKLYAGKTLCEVNSSFFCVKYTNFLSWIYVAQIIFTGEFSDNLENVNLNNWYKLAGYACKHIITFNIFKINRHNYEAFCIEQTEGPNLLQYEVLQSTVPVRMNLHFKPSYFVEKQKNFTAKGLSSINLKFEANMNINSWSHRWLFKQELHFFQL